MSDSVEAEHDQLVAQFQAFTGQENVDECRETLEAHGWNIEMAVQDALNEQEGKAPVYGHLHRQSQAETSGESSPPPVVDDFPDDGGPGLGAAGLRRRNPIAPGPAAGRLGLGLERALQPANPSWWQWCVSWVTSPLRYLGDSAWFLARFVLGIVTGAGGQGLVPVPDPEGDVLRFAESFRQKYGAAAANSPDFLVSSYARALRRAKEEMKFLLVYCHNENNQYTDTICQQLLCSPGLAAFINSNMLVFGVGLDSPEGRRVGAALRAWGQPMLVMLVHRGGSLTCVDRISLAHGVATVDEILVRLMQVVETHRTVLTDQQQQRQRIEQDRLIREQQEQEYTESLRRDKERDDRRRHEEEAKLQLLQAKEDKIKEQERREEELRERRFLASANLPQEPELADAGVVRLSIRLPENTRLERRFLASQSLAVVHQFVFSHDEAPAKFTLQTTYPKRDLVTTGGDVQSIAEAELGPAAVLMVRDEDSDDEDESDTEER